MLSERTTFDSRFMVAVPAFNESMVVGKVISDLRRHFSTVVVIDDGSSDDTGELAKLAGGTVLRHCLNCGQGAALITAMNFAAALPFVDYLITFDADGQHNSLDAVAIARRLHENQHDLVLGSRFRGSATGVGFMRRALLQLRVRLYRLFLGLPLTDVHNGLRGLNRVAFTGIKIRSMGMGHADDFLREAKRLRLRLSEIPVHISYSEYSKSKGQSLINSVNILFENFWSRFS